MTTRTSHLPKGITRRADGRYMWRFQMNGKKFCGYARTIKAAKSGLKEAKSEAARKNAGECSSSAETLDLWFDYWLNSIKAGLKETTKERYRQIYCACIMERIGFTRLALIDVGTVQGILNELHHRNCTYPYIHSVRTLLNNLLEAAVRHQKVHINPVPYTEMPVSPSPYGTKDAFTENELTLLFERIENSSVRQICYLAVLTGMRIGEILALTWDDVDFDRREIYICHTLAYYPERGFYLDEPKTRTSRRILPLMEDSTELLTKIRMSKSAEAEKSKDTPFSNLIFRTAHGRPFFSSNINKELRKAVKALHEVGILPEERRYSFHSFRHTFASQCLRSGMNPKILSALLGHSSIRVTLDVYTHVETEDLRKALQMVRQAR